MQPVWRLGVCGRVSDTADSTDMSIFYEPNRRATLTVTEAAKILGISRTTAYESVGRGEIPARRFGLSEAGT